MLKKIVLIFSILALFTSIFAFIYIKVRNHQEDRSVYHLSLKDVDKLQDGDIILRYGFGLVSDVIVEKLNEEYKISHCGVVCQSDSGWRVIHCESSRHFEFDGVQNETLQNYVKRSHRNSIIVVRYANTKASSGGSQISQAAVNYYKQKVAFDYSFDIHDHSSMYCSEMIWKIIKDEFNDDIFVDSTGKFEHRQMANFLDKHRFSTIINHHEK